MKRVFSVLLIALSVLIGFQQALIVVHFKLNRQVIEYEFCVNKNNPNLQCHGTCFLKKRLLESENTNTASVYKYQKVDVLPISTTRFEARNIMIELQDNIPAYKEIRYTEPCREIFVPLPIG